MSRSTSTSQRGNMNPLLPAVTLARWRLRQTWGLLLVTGVGIIAAVMLVCAVPLYSDVSMSAGLRDVLNASPQNTTLAVHANAELISSSVIMRNTSTLDNELQSQLGAYLGPSQFSIETPILYILSNQSDGIGSFSVTDDQLIIDSTPIDAAGSHVTMVQGQLPAVSSNDVQVALSAASAMRLKVHVGSVLKTKINFILEPIKSVERTIELHVVGIFNLRTASDPFWEGNSFAPAPRGAGRAGSIYKLLVSNETFISVLSHISSDPALSGLKLESEFSLSWYYHLDPSRITIKNLNDLRSGIDTIQTDIANRPEFKRPPSMENTKLTAPTNLDQYHDRIAVAQIPVYTLLAVILGLVLFFVSMMADLLVDRQSEAIAVLRSRGASRLQIFGALLTQGLGLGLIAVIVGPLLALVVVYFFAQHTLASGEQGVLSIITDHPIDDAFGLGGYALGTAGVAVLTTALSINRAARQDVLAVRREAARSTRQSLWQRLNLDIVAAVIALLGYGFSLYLTNSGVLDLQTRLLLLTPLTVLGAFFVLLACLLLFLRLVPLLLQAGAWLTARRRGASGLLALAQMARAPRQPVRMTLLLALATGFAIFTLIFTASQSQRILDVASYQAAADFSGSLVSNADLTSKRLKSQTAAFNHIPGVLSTTLGYTAEVFKDNINLELMTVDADTFASTAIWPAADASLPLNKLMSQLVAQRSDAIAGAQIPAVVDQATWDALHLGSDPHFLLPFATGTLEFVAITKVPYIPPVNNKGILADFTTFSAVYQESFPDINNTLDLNSVWLHTQSDATSLARVRATLNNPNACCLQVNPLIDRQALITSLQQEPLYLDLLGVLVLGATTALLLALLGNLLASWLNARSRVTNFAVLRALGAASHHIGGILTWEQGLIYIMAILLGVGFGALLSVLVVPVLVFTNVAASGAASPVTSTDFYLLQRVPPTQIILPSALGIILGALVVLCIIALTIMIRTVSQTSIGQTLRLNED